MTFGEKLQLLRKQRKLSQEDLAQKLLISRQTVSLWEKNQTLPTIDNLIRLKEIFEIPIDDFLSDDADQENAYAPPVEIPLLRIDFRLTKEEFSKARAYAYIRAVLPNAVFFLCLLFSCFFLWKNSNENGQFFISFGFAILLITKIIILIRNAKGWNKSLENVEEKTYVYELYPDRLVYVVKRNHVTQTQLTILPTEVKGIRKTKRFRFFVFKNSLFLIPAPLVDENPPLVKFFTDCTTSHKAAQKSRPSKKRSPKNKFFSVFLIILSIASLFGAMLVMLGLTNINHKEIENAWVFFLFLPAPIASIAFGIIGNKKGYGNTPNVGVGIAMAVLMTIYGCFSFIFGAIYSNSYAYVDNAATTIGISLPEKGSSRTQTFSGGTAIDGKTLYYYTDVYYTDSEAEKFEAEFSDVYWKTEFPTTLATLSNVYYIGKKDEIDYRLLYNVTTKEYNISPAKSGVYRFIYIVYDTNENHLQIIEYDLNYVI